MSVNIIKLNRGDSLEFPVVLKNNLNEVHILENTEVLYFALLYPNQPFEEAILIKGYTNNEELGLDQDLETGEIIIRLTPNDTRTLAPGVYYYTVKLQRGGSLEIIDDLDEPNEVRTIIERTKFIINE